MLAITKPELLTAPSFVLDDHGDVHSKDVHVGLAEEDVFVLFKSKTAELVEKGRPLSKLAKFWKIIPLPILRNILETAVFKEESGLAVEEADLA